MSIGFRGLNRTFSTLAAINIGRGPASMSWTEVKTTVGGVNGGSASDAAIGRSSHSITVVGNAVYMLGGEHVPRVPLGSKLHVLDLDTHEWRVAHANGEAPSPRVAHGAAALDGVIYVFGGRSGIEMGEGAQDDLFSFDTASGMWSEVKTEGGPPARSYHAMVADATRAKVYVFGGCGAAGKGRLNDLWELDVRNSTWKMLPTSPSIKGRGGPGLAVDGPGRALYIVGGFAGNELGDVHRFDLEKEKWEEVLTPRSVLRPRSMFGGAHVVDRHIVVTCGEVDPSDKGHEGAGMYANDVAALDLERVEEGWQQMSVSCSAPSPRGWFAGATLHDGVIVHGGISPDNERLSSMFLLRV